MKYNQVFLIYFLILAGCSALSKKHMNPPLTPSTSRIENIYNQHNIYNDISNYINNIEDNTQNRCSSIDISNDIYKTICTSIQSINLDIQSLEYCKNCFNHAIYIIGKIDLLIESIKNISDPNYQVIQEMIKTIRSNIYRINLHIEIYNNQSNELINKYNGLICKGSVASTLNFF